MTRARTERILAIVESPILLSSDEREDDMLRAMIEKRGESFPHNPLGRGYHAVYRENEINHCPGCGRTHWYVGRVSAECGFCGAALPLAEASARGIGGFSRGHASLTIGKAA